MSYDPGSFRGPFHLPRLPKPEGKFNAFEWDPRADSPVDSESPSLLVQRLFQPLLPVLSAIRIMRSGIEGWKPTALNPLNATRQRPRDIV
jgi:hypothetical protein